MLNIKTINGKDLGNKSNFGEMEYKDYTPTTIDSVVDLIKSIISTEIDRNKNKFNKFKDIELNTSVNENAATLDSWSYSISFGACVMDSENPGAHTVIERRLNFFVVRNTQTNEYAIIITNGEYDGLRIVFKSITKYPMPSLEKYLPNIIGSTINILINMIH